MPGKEIVRQQVVHLVLTGVMQYLRSLMSMGGLRSKMRLLTSVYHLELWTFIFDKRFFRQRNLVHHFHITLNDRLLLYDLLL